MGRSKDHPGYRCKSQRVEWIAYDAVYRVWQGEHGEKHPEAAYRRFVGAGVDMTRFARKHNRQPSRDIAAWLARRLTVATLRELTGPFGLGHPDSVRGLLNRAEAAISGSAKLRKEVDQLRREIQQGSAKHEKRV